MDIVSPCFDAGFVYNVSPYMEYHPGGEDELMRAAGADGTDLFNEVSGFTLSERCMRGLSSETFGGRKCLHSFEMGGLEL